MEEFAIKVFLQHLIANLSESDLKEQLIHPYEKLKLLTLTESSEQNIVKLSEELIDTYKITEFNIDSAQEIDFSLIIMEMPLDIHIIVCSVLKNLFLSLTKEKQDQFLSKYLNEFQALLDVVEKEEFLGNNDESNEERMDLFPNFLK